MKRPETTLAAPALPANPQPVRSAEVFFHRTLTPDPIRYFVVALGPNNGEPDVCSRVHSGHGLTPARVLDVTHDTIPFVDDEMIERTDRVVWEGDRVVGLSLNTYSRPEFFGGRNLLLEIAADHSDVRVILIEPTAKSKTSP